MRSPGHAFYFDYSQLCKPMLLPQTLAKIYDSSAISLSLVAACVHFRFARPASPHRCSYLFLLLFCRLCSSHRVHNCAAIRSMRSVCAHFILVPRYLAPMLQAGYAILSQNCAAQSALQSATLPLTMPSTRKSDCSGWPGTTSQQWLGASVDLSATLMVRLVIERSLQALFLKKCAT